MFDNNYILLSICSSVCYIFVSAVVSVGSQTYLPYGGEIFLTAVVFYALMSKGASPHLSGFGRHITRMAVISCNRSKVAAVRNQRRGAHHGSRSTPRCFEKAHIPFAGSVDEVAVIPEYLLSVPFVHPQRGEVCVPNFINAAFSTLGKVLTILMRLQDSLHRLPPVASITHHISQGRSAKYRELQCTLLCLQRG